MTRAGLADDYAYCEEIVRKRESNFSLGFQFLPPDKKLAIHVVYAFCRYVDDISDEYEGDPRGLLKEWEEELKRIYGPHEPSHAIGRALKDLITRYKIPSDGFLDLIRGCERDQLQKNYRTFGELSEYCELVATSIAKVSLPVYGWHDYAKAFPHARDLSFAFQLTNILRDVREDALRGRCYLPSEDLFRYGLKIEDLVNRPAEAKGAAELFRQEGERCEAYFKSGRAVLEYLESDSRLCVRIMTDAYYTLLRKILENPVRALQAQTVLTPEDKFKITGKTP